MLIKMKRDINQQDFKIVDLHFVKFESFEVMNHISTTQFQVDENSN